MVVKEVEFKVVLSVYEDEQLEDIKCAIERGLDKEGYGCLSVEIGAIVGTHEEDI